MADPGKRLLQGGEHYAFEKLPWHYAFGAGGIAYIELEFNAVSTARHESQVGAVCSNDIHQRLKSYLKFHR